MTQEERSENEFLLEVLTRALPSIAGPGESNRENPPDPEELLDLVDGRLSATEREDLIERLIRCPDSQEILSDILYGIEYADSMERNDAARTPTPLETLREWIENWKTLLTPAVVLYSPEVRDQQVIRKSLEEHGLLDPSDPGSLDESFAEKAREIRQLIEEGRLSGELLNLMAAVMEIHLVLARDHGGDVREFIRVWKPVCLKVGVFLPEKGETGEQRFLDWTDAYAQIYAIYEKGLELDPDQGEIYVGMGRIDLQLGDYEKAEIHLEKSVALSPGDPVVHHLMARVREMRKQRFPKTSS